MKTRLRLFIMETRDADVLGIWLPAGPILHEAVSARRYRPRRTLKRDVADQRGHRGLLAVTPSAGPWATLTRGNFPRRDPC